MKKKFSYALITAACVFFAPMILSAQQVGVPTREFNRFSVGAEGGMLTFFGDIKKYDIAPHQDEIRFGGGVQMVYQFSPAFGIRAQGLMGQLAGQRNNYSFEADLIEGNLSALVSLNHLMLPRAGISRWMSLYAFGGAGVASHKTVLKLNNVQSDTEDAAILAIPVGLGMKIRLADRIDLHAETGHRITTNDRIDAFVGSGTDNDLYNYTSIGLTFRLGPKARGIQWRTRPIPGEGISVRPMTVPQTPAPRQEPPVQQTEPERTAPAAPRPQPEATPQRTERITPTDQDPHSGNPYFVVLGSFRVRDNAYRFVDTLKTQGFNPFVVLSESGFYRVCVNSYADRTWAVSRIQQIRRDFPQYKDAWLLIREQ